MAASSNDTMESDMAPSPNMIESRQLNHTEGRGRVFWYLGYAAVKVRKRLYVTSIFLSATMSFTWVQHRIFARGIRRGGFEGLVSGFLLIVGSDFQS